MSDPSPISDGQAAREGLSSEQRAQSLDTNCVDSINNSIDQPNTLSPITSHNENLQNNENVQEPPPSSEVKQAHIAGTLIKSKSGDKLANGIIAQVSPNQSDQDVANSGRLEKIVTCTQVDKTLDKKGSSVEVAGASSLPQVSSDEDSTAGELVEGPAAERPSDQPYQHVSEIENIAYGVQLTGDTSYEIVTSEIVIANQTLNISTFLVGSGQDFHHCFDDGDYDWFGSLHQPLSDNSPLPFTYVFSDIPP